MGISLGISCQPLTTPHRRYGGGAAFLGGAGQGRVAASLRDRLAAAGAAVLVDEVAGDDGQLRHRGRETCDGLVQRIRQQARLSSGRRGVR